jgi:hypothetical protein
MTTKITILGCEPKEKELKKIEFVKGLAMAIEDGGSFFEPKYSPSDYESIQVNLSGDGRFDLFICKINNVVIHYYLGHFNDGIV